mgnify:CR=1 FL=1
MPEVINRILKVTGKDGRVHSILVRSVRVKNTSTYNNYVVDDNGKETTLTEYCSGKGW